MSVGPKGLAEYQDEVGAGAGCSIGGRLVWVNLDVFGTPVTIIRGARMTASAFNSHFNHLCRNDQEPRFLLYSPLDTDLLWIECCTPTE